jgi:hypothetical protein
MFAYNPTVNDNSGQILGASQANAAATRAQGMQNFGQSIGDGLAAMGSGIAGGMTKAAENKMTSDSLDQMADQFANTPGMDGQTPLMSQDELDKFSKMSLGAKQGMIVPKQAMFDQALKNSYQSMQMQSYLDRMNQSAANQAALRQPPANQVPMGGAAPAAAAVSPDTTQSTGIIAPGIKTKSYY